MSDAHWTDGMEFIAGERIGAGDILWIKEDGKLHPEHRLHEAIPEDELRRMERNKACMATHNINEGDTIILGKDALVRVSLDNPIEVPPENIKINNRGVYYGE